jgi:hypothetical protein
MVHLLQLNLIGQKFRVKLERHLAEQKHIYGDVTQGSVLTPLLYNVFIADIPRMPGTEISQLTDDTDAYTSNKNIKYAISNNTDKSTVPIHTKRRQIPRNRLNICEAEIPCLQWHNT